ncbi:MAG: DUF58 domain-containing protein [Candidatus Eisenbacteria bacterium]|nr:DUF58 domain-containing protein [Candidatus Eisenbacteria bacterium]
MELRARLIVEGFVTGLHRSPYKGFSVEFAEHRQYMPGDPLKHIDWKVYGKTDRFYVKEYEEETNLRGYVLLDASASMGYSSGGMSKLEYGRYLSAAVTYLMLKQQDSVGLLVFDDAVREFVPPRSSPRQLHVLLSLIDSVEASSTTDVGQVLHELARRMTRRGLVILISDLLDDPASILPGLKHFRHLRHEVVVFHVLDPKEAEFDFDIDATFRDMETGDLMTTEPFSISGDYRAAVKEWMAGLRRRCAESGIDYVPVMTTTPYDRALFSYLEKRKRLG